MMRKGSKKSLKMKCPDGIIIHDRKNGEDTKIFLGRVMESAAD